MYCQVTMKLEHSKWAKSPNRRCSVAQQLHLLSLLRVLELNRTRSLPTPVFCQPQSSPELPAGYRNTMPLQVQSHGKSLALGILKLLT